MKLWLAAVALAWATAPQADTTCSLAPALSDDPSTLLVRDIEPVREAVILVSDRTLVFDCPTPVGTRALECYGKTEAPIQAPTQLNVAARELGPGSVVVVTIRNLFFGKNEHVGFHKRHATVHVYTVERCDTP